MHSGPLLPVPYSLEFFSAFLVVQRDFPENCVAGCSVPRETLELTIDVWNQHK